MQSKNRVKLRIIRYGDLLLNISFYFALFFIDLIIYIFSFMFEKNLYITSSTAICY